MSRLSLSRQLLLLQMCIVVFVVAAVSGVSLVQSSATFTREEGRRMLGAAESLATEGLVRQSTALTLDGETPGESAVQARLQEPIGVRLENARTSAGATYAILRGAEGGVLGATLPTEDADLELDPSVAAGASWSGIGDRYGRRTIEAQVPVFGDGQDDRPVELLGVVVLGRTYPSRLEVLGSAAPSVFAYLALAMLLGAAGSLLLSRRVKRQTLGLEPSEIAGLVEQREAMLHGVREGVLGVDMRGRVAFVNDEALHLLGTAGPAAGTSVDDLGQEAEVTSILRRQHREQDLVVAVGRTPAGAQPPAGDGPRTPDRVGHDDARPDGAARPPAQSWESQAGTDTLRAQAHEFRNRLHTIGGLVELGQSAELGQFVRRGRQPRRAPRRGERVDRGPRGGRAAGGQAEPGRRAGGRLHLAGGPAAPPTRPLLSADLATVVGNLVDNALDAVGPLGGGEVDVLVREEDGAVVVEVRDSGPGIAPELVEEVFTSGFTTKAAAGGYRGFGLALTRTLCVRRGGSVSVRNDDGAVFSARLPLPAAVR